MTGGSTGLAVRWSAIIACLLITAFIVTPISFMAHYFFLIWALTVICVFYRMRVARGEVMPGIVRYSFIICGLASCVLSFASIPAGIGKAPYSLDDFTLLLAGASLIYFAGKGISSASLPQLMPILVVTGYQLLGNTPGELAGFLIQPTVTLLTAILSLLGLGPQVTGNIIAYDSIGGELVRMSIVGDCTGIWSLIAYGISAATIVMLFQGIRPQGFAVMLIGFPVTYAVNIARVTVLFLGGYYFGNTIVTQAIHIHIGWIVFSIWMFVFWYSFFRRGLHSAASQDDAGDETHIEG
ncbi:archaeosortase/exosortase family protein [Candidatus Altiarchaeota archaeon]